jgi:hypothetical protein
VCPRGEVVLFGFVAEHKGKTLRRLATRKFTRRLTKRNNSSTAPTTAAVWKPAVRVRQPYSAGVTNTVVACLPRTITRPPPTCRLFFCEH